MPPKALPPNIITLEVTASYILILGGRNQSVRDTSRGSQGYEPTDLTPDTEDRGVGARVGGVQSHDEEWGGQGDPG